MRNAHYKFQNFSVPKLFMKGFLASGIIWLSSCRHGIRLLNSLSLLAVGLSCGYETISRHQPFVIGWSRYSLGLPRSQWIVRSCEQWECPLFFSSHWQSPCTALMAGNLGLCKETVKESRHGMDHTRPAIFMSSLKMKLSNLHDIKFCELTKVKNRFTFVRPFDAEARKSGRTRWVPWLLMSWLLLSPGHQQPWHWLSRINRAKIYTRKDFN